MKRSKILAPILLLFFFLVIPFIQGAARGLKVRAVVFGTQTTALNTKVFTAGLSGSNAQSLAWSVTAPVSIQVDLIYVDRQGIEIVISPAELGFGQVNPIAATGDDVVAFSIPVAPKIRFTVTGVANGVLIFSDS